MKLYTAFILSILFISLTQPLQARTGKAKPDNYKIIHAGKLLAVPGKKPRTKMTIIVKNGRIENIENGFVSLDMLDVAENSVIELVDLSDKFILPGLMDAHVHLNHQPSRSRHRKQRGDRDKPTGAQFAVNTMIYARRTLAAGFTSVRDLGSDDQSVFAVRNAINQGRMIGPRILVAGSALAITGGHGDSIAIENTGQAITRLKDGTCDGPMECRKAVRYQYKLGADLIKFTATGGAASNTGMESQFFEDEIQAIVKTAHLLGLKATTHAYAAGEIKQEIRAGVNSIEHGFLLDDEAIQMMKEGGVWLVPTISASYPPPILKIPDPESVKLRNKYRAFERAYAAGVKIAFGSDAGTFTHGTNAKEFGMMVGFGMSEKDAIYAATISTAQLFGIDDEVGTIESGKLADIIAVKGNPLDDISLLHKIDFVMKSGKIAKRDGQMTEPFSY